MLRRQLTVKNISTISREDWQVKLQGMLMGGTSGSTWISEIKLKKKTLKN